jgi:hypothetical protein
MNYFPMMSDDERAQAAEHLARKFYRGNRLFLSIGFALIGAIEGLGRWESSGERQNVSMGLDKLWAERHDVEKDVIEMKTVIADAEKKGAFFDAQYNALEARMRKVEIDEAKLQEDSPRAPTR